MRHLEQDGHELVDQPGMSLDQELEARRLKREHGAVGFGPQARLGLRLPDRLSSEPRTPLLA